jgi:hypothetical protein
MENKTKSIGVICFVCGDPIELESCEFNENGQPIHPACAVKSTGREDLPKKRMNWLVLRIQQEKDHEMFTKLVEELNGLVAKKEDRFPTNPK